MTLARWCFSAALLVTAGSAAASTPACDFASRVQALRAKARSGAALTADVRPPSVGSVRSERFPVVLHWQEGVEPAYVTEMLAVVESVWQEEVGTLGFLPPLPDAGTDGDAAFDVYLVTTLEPGVGGYAGFSGFYDETPRADAVGYLVIAGDLDPRLRRFVVAHEFFHASQMAYDWWEDLSFMEGSATWIARRAFGDDDIWWRYVPFFNAEPWKALDFISIKAPYQYGTALFAHFLDQRFGAAAPGTPPGAFVRGLWEGTVQDGIDNEPDFLDVATAQVGGADAFAEAYAEFGVWRVLTGTRKRWARFTDAAGWADSVSPTFEATIEPGIDRASGTTAQALQPWSHAYVGVRQTPGDTRAVAFTVTGDPASRFDVRWIQLAGDAAAVETVGTASGGETLSFSLPPRGDLEEAIIVVTNVTDGAYDADTSPWEGRRVGWTFSRD
jgi:hypothetical protein